MKAVHCWPLSMAPHENLPVILTGAIVVTFGLPRRNPKADAKEKGGGA
jgi:hypothetical protein